MRKKNILICRNSSKFAWKWTKRGSTGIEWLICICVSRIFTKVWLRKEELIWEKVQKNNHLTSQLFLLQNERSGMENSYPKLNYLYSFITLIVHQSSGLMTNKWSKATSIIITFGLKYSMCKDTYCLKTTIKLEKTRPLNNILIEPEYKILKMLFFLHKRHLKKNPHVM